MKVETTYEKSGNSALLDGIEQLINRSLATCDMGGISFHFSVAIPKHYKSQYHVGFLGLLENGDQSESSSSQIEQFGISVRTDINTLYVLQDFETFIIKFSPVIDVTKIGMITMKNYYDLGISEFERFSTVIRYMKSVVKIEREGRMERIPVNDVVRNVLEHSESDYTTWYGLNYETKFVLQPCSSNRLTKQEKEEESKGFEEEFKQIRPIQRQKKYLREDIMCLDDNDDEKVMSELEKACVSCGVDCGVIGLKVTSETLASYKKYLGKEELICGPICAACRNQYRRNVSYSKK
ncbi:hypothetical protein C9374_001917 [Naegleria lovaniensis]|uniref:Uncharacterized protein n=1 Tax=Naegleria lovaniensis TaxID=51637 RepID=A0AA88GTR4_NAELO|nr:uncharacterized protein C9374_001917 [Naegleria lovaniensis]KAG2386882.1 hypothetical protein C9374_001917 [Naegleria lovaniensis]